LISIFRPIREPGIEATAFNSTKQYCALVMAKLRFCSAQGFDFFRKCVIYREHKMITAPESLPGGSLFFRGVPEETSAGA